MEQQEKQQIETINRKKAMEKIIGNAKAQVEFTVTLVLTDKEAKALIAIVGYGADEFLKGFYEKLGKSYLQPYEVDVKNLFHTIKEALPSEISKIDKAKQAINEALQSFK
jgi:hypothetical protein